MITVAVLFGGKSTEHEISIISALQVINNLDTTKFEIMPIYIDKDGKYFTGESLKKIKFYRNVDYKKLKEITILPSSNFVYIKRLGGFFKWKKLDFAFLILHGLNGEDGTVQSIFELNKIPYSSSGVLASAIGMDKVAMKTMFKGLDIPVLPYIWFFKEEWNDSKNKIVKQIETELNYPVVVKPANLGSSIGISICKDEDELLSAIDVAFCFDFKIIVERAVKKLKEINISCMGENKTVETSVTEEPLNWENFLSFEDKYMSKNASKRVMPAKISSEMESKVVEYAKKIFVNFFCKGIVRIDFMLDEETNELYINEINTIPGSLAFFLWNNRGYDFKLLLEKNIKYSIKNDERKKDLIYKFDSGILNNVGSGYKKK